VDRLFEELIHRRWGLPSPRGEEWSPQLDIYETEQEFILVVDLPGVEEHEVSVTVENGDLVLQGQRTIEQVGIDHTCYYRERRSGRFVRRLRLPAAVDRDHMGAEFRDGILRVTLPKRPREERKVR
jgi:HSP20 family protein